MTDRLKKTLEDHKREYLQPLLELAKLDTHCIGHGIDGGLEKAGQFFL